LTFVVWDYFAAVRFGGLVDRNLTLVVWDYITTVRFGGLVHGNLALGVWDYVTTVRFGGLVYRNLAFVCDDGTTIGLGRNLDRELILALNALLDGSHHGQGEGVSGNLAHDEKGEEESEEGRRREEHCC